MGTSGLAWHFKLLIEHYLAGLFVSHFEPILVTYDQTLLVWDLHELCRINKPPILDPVQVLEHIFWQVRVETWIISRLIPQLF